MNAIGSVAVVGAGTMGLGITLVCASQGFDTLLYDLLPAQTEKALRAIDENLSQRVEKGKLTAIKKSEIRARIRPANTLSDLRVDLVIEAAVERLDIKKKLLADLEIINEGKAILATNTSSISVSEIAAGLKDPSRCIGIHFFNPADRMQLVEIISGEATSRPCLDQMRKFAADIGKTAVLAKDSPGFIVNRVARPYYAEALRLLEGGVGSVFDIDALLRSAGFKMGPFELMDLIGVDTNLAVTTSVYEGMGKPSRFKPSRTQQQLVAQGSLGRKSGKGFYEYSPK